MNNGRAFQDISNRVNATFKPRELTLVIFLIAVILVKLSGFAYFIEKLNWIIFGIIIWLISNFIFRFLINKQKTSSAIIKLYFAYAALVEIPILGMMTYNIGGVEWIGGIFFLFPVVYVSIVLSRKNAFAIASVASFYYIALVLLPYFKIVPFQPFFRLGIDLYQNLNYVIINILFVTTTFYFIGYAASLFTDLLKKRTVDLEKAETALKNEKTTLEGKVRTRTKELEELAKSLEKKVEERTGETKEKMQELEKFNKLAVGREMKMIELKKKIKDLEERLKKGNL